jgi:hypothetical protein
MNNSGGTYVVDRTSATTNLSSLKMVTGNAFGFQVRYDNNTGLGGPTGGAAAVGTWYFVTVVRDYAAGFFRLYLNDTLLASTVDNGGALTVPALKIGSHCCTAADTVSGDIPYFAFYGTALTQSQIASHCNATQARFSGATCN